MINSWTFRDGVALAVLLVLACLATRPVWLDISSLALASEESSYILLTLPVALLLAWRRRERLRLCRPRATLLGAAVIGIGWGLIALGRERAIDLSRDLGALLVVAGAVFTVTGPDVFHRFSAAWCALLFLIPVPGRIRGIVAVPLQEVTADVTAFLLNILAFPVEHRGNLLIVNGVEVAVAEACNGMRMVAAMALISYAFVFSTPMRLWARLLLLAASPIIAVLVNVVRLVPTSLLYGYSSHDTADMFHDLAGWGVLALAMGAMWGLLSLLSYLELPLATYRVRDSA